MIQEIIALSVFLIAVFYSIFSLGRFMIPLKKKSSHACGSESDTCGC